MFYGGKITGKVCQIVSQDRKLSQKSLYLPMQTAIATILTLLITIMALAQYHDSLAEYPSVGIILAYEGLKENIAIHNF